MFKKVLLSVVFACAVLGGGALASKPRSDGALASKAANSTKDERPVSVSQSKQATSDGLSYETHIPRQTAKGYYEPKVVPHPVGKPVYVNGYYRKNGTYVQPHFRSLPRR